MSATTDIHQLQTNDGMLTVQFVHVGDRFAHFVMLGEGPRLESIEGNAQEDWPASGAVQQLSTETIDGRTMILGVGGSGTSHFSVSVQAIDGASIPAKDRVRGGGLHFDWAVRLSKSGMDEFQQASQNGPSPLGSAYRGDAVIQIAPVAPSSLMPWPTETDRNRRIVPRLDRQDRTIRWNYVIRGPIDV